MKLAWIARLVTAALAVSLLAPTSIAGAEKQEAGKKGTTYAGTVDGTDAYIAIIVSKKQAFGYVCDGEAITHWLRGTIRDGAVALEAQTGAFVVAELTDGALTGTALLAVDPSVTDPEERLATATIHAFEATRAKGDAGLFRQEKDVDGATFAAGWVVLDDGSLRGEVTVARVAGEEGTTTTTAPPATTAPAPVTPSQTAPTTTAPPGTTTPANPGGVQADVGTDAVGQIAPPDIQTLFPPAPLPADVVITPRAGLSKAQACANTKAAFRNIRAQADRARRDGNDAAFDAAQVALDALDATFDRLGCAGDIRV